MPHTPIRSISQARVGDFVEVVGHSVGDSPRAGEILEIAGTDRIHFKVRWEDGHVSILYPGGDVVIRRSQKRRTKREHVG